MLRPTISDHRHRRFPLLPYTAFFPFPRNPDRSARLAAASILPQPRITRRELLHGLGYSLLGLPFFYLSAHVPAWLSFGLHLPLWIMLLAAIPLGATPPLIIIFIFRRVAADRLARYYTAAGYCASCAYDLKSIAPEPDGCQLCPECGAAWRIRADRLSIDAA
jgi:hypothetical protein